MLIGAHVPTAGGYPKMIDYALEVGCECIQMFAKSPRQWAAKPLDLKAVEEFLNLKKKYGVGPVLTHTAYLINLSSIDEEMRSKSIDAFAEEILRAASLGADAVNTHIGNDAANNEQAAIERTINSLVRALDSAQESLETGTVVGNPKSLPRIVLENTARAGSTFGYSVEQLTGVINGSGLSTEQLGICIDTCHAWAAGYDVGSVEGVNEFVAQIDSAMGIQRWGWIHANDCKYGRGMKKDRHEWIGRGEIGDEGFKALIGHPLLQHINVVTEMPGEMPEKDIINIERLKSFR